ncbi:MULTISPECIES: hypothetical protein [Thalassospira]|jgi:hypothetical protein|nr:MULTISPECIES: hypothetical protein [Thalassospira]MBL4843181.1 hypothetical protein [Thalassospira sp.]MBR9778988.1 hypothetical protein [Rhodospirillales bacterium]MBR9817582.1 hypothetical protein [Rhodospirillales bacterium]MCD1593879.1 hypothetical protein [Thalassospira xiamenensis]OCK09001.1 hypothetical protein KO164_3180 [Thalassospira sp. KO164]|tara:strand:+ start:2354 stop:2614 length:261 start_codon:yes stop_codon:yes gene_type:complete
MGNGMDALSREEREEMRGNRFPECWCVMVSRSKTSWGWGVVVVYGPVARQGAEALEKVLTGAGFLAEAVKMSGHTVDIADLRKLVD